jgi:DNA-binding LytR/AlgR family response regulator
MPAAYSAIIADDEQPLRQWLKTALAQAWPELTICAEAENGPQALDLIAAHKPQIAFLDIKMPGLSGLEVARRIAGACRIVFITAYDHFAVEAFEKEAVDYLLKPVDPQRLARTVARLKTGLAGPQPAPDALAALLQSLQERLAPARPQPYLQWLQVQDKNALRLIPVDEIACLQAQDKYTVVITCNGEYLIRKPIKELAEELDPDRFWQIHRSTIVRAAAIDKVSSSLTSHYLLTLKEIEGTFTISRSFRHRFRSM